MKKFHYHLLLLAMTFLWGASWPWAHIAVQEVPPLIVSSIRFGIAAISLFFWLLYRGQSTQLLHLGRRQFWGLLAAACSGMLLYSGTSVSAMQFVSTSKAAISGTLNSVVPMLAAAWVFKEHLNAKILLGIIIAIFGSLIAISHGDLVSIMSGGMGLGEYLLLISVIFWTGYGLIGRIVLRRTSPVIATFATSFLGSIMLIIASIIVYGTEPWISLWQISLQAKLSLFGLGFGGTALAYLWYYVGIQHLGVGSVSGYMVLVPIFGISLAAWWLNDPLDGSLLLGSAMAIGGMLLMNFSRKM